MDDQDPLFLNSCHTAALRAEIVSRLRVYYAHQIEGHPEEFFQLPQVITFLRKISTLVTPDSEKYVFITINPQSNGDLSLKEWYDRVDIQLQKALKKKYILDFIYSYEFRSISNHPKRGFGLHIHLCIRLTDMHRAKQICHIRREFFSTFRSVCLNSRAIHLKYNKDPLNFVHYLQGFKEGQYKDSHETDVHMRNILQISPYICSSDHFGSFLLVEEPMANTHEFASTSVL